MTYVVSTLRKAVERLTTQNQLWLPTESFILKNVDISVEYESSKIDLHQWDGTYSIHVFDKELQKSVTLDFHDESVFVFSHSYKKRRTMLFWKKPELKTTKTSFFHFEESEDDDTSNENIQFVWDRLPYYWKR